MAQRVPPVSVLELFSGVGGMRLALGYAGIEARFTAVDVSDWTNALYEYAFGERPAALDLASCQPHLMAHRKRLPELDRRMIIVERKLVAEVAGIFGEGRQRALPSRGVLALIFSRHRSRAGGTTDCCAKRRRTKKMLGERPLA